MTLRMVGISVDTSGAVLVGFPIPWGAVDADIEDYAATERRERK